MNVSNKMIILINEKIIHYYNYTGEYYNSSAESRMYQRMQFSAHRIMTRATLILVFIRITHVPPLGNNSALIEP